MENIKLSHDVLIENGFDHGNDNGHECDYIKAGFIICSGVDDEGDYFIVDATGQQIYTLSELQKLLKDKALK